MVAAAIGNEILWVRFPWETDDLVDAGSSGSVISRKYTSVLTDFSPSIDLSSELPWSVAAWICRKGGTTVVQYLWGMTGAPRFYAAFGVSGINALTIGIDGTPIIFTSQTATVGVATHFAVTFDGANQLRIYKNGTLGQTITTTSGGTLPNVALSIGAQTGGNLTDQWQGAIEDFRIFNRVLTAEECATLSASAPSAQGGTSRPSHPMYQQVIG